VRRFVVLAERLEILRVRRAAVGVRRQRAEDSLKYW
jgi:hypothetical protein